MRTKRKLILWLLVLALMAGYMPVIPAAEAFAGYRVTLLSGGGGTVNVVDGYRLVNTSNINDYIQ